MANRWLGPLLALAAGAAAGALPARSAGDVVGQAIARHGGHDAWAARSTVRFHKTTTRFSPDGKADRRPTQLHRYRLRPFRARIEWQEEGRSVVLVNDGRQAVKLVDGAPARETADLNQARNVTFGSHYVFNMPWKLADPGVHLSIAGPRTLPAGASATGVRVEYEKGAGDAGGMHVWTYFFEKDGRLAANHLTYGPERHEWTEYHDDVVVAGLTIARRRLGFEADARSRRGTRASEIVYEDVAFDVPMEDALFVVPEGR